MKRLFQIMIPILVLMYSVLAYTNHTCLDNQTLQIINIFNITEDGVVTEYETLRIEECDYNCTETMVGNRCDYTPSQKAGIWVLIILAILGAFYLTYKMLWGLFK